MDKALYPMIFKRKSFHLFRETEHINQAEIEQIEAQHKTFTPLVNDIQTAIRIVPADKTTCKRGQEYCILLYSERKDTTYKTLAISENSLICISLHLESAHSGSESASPMSLPITVLTL